MDRLNDLSALLRSFIACLHSSSNHGFLGLELIEDFGIVFSAISRRMVVKSGIGSSDSNVYLLNRFELSVLKVAQSACLNFQHWFFLIIIVFGSCQNNWKMVTPATVIMNVPRETIKENRTCKR